MRICVHIHIYVPMYMYICIYTILANNQPTYHHVFLPSPKQLSLTKIIPCLQNETNYAVNIFNMYRFLSYIHTIHIYIYLLSTLPSHLILLHTFLNLLVESIPCVLPSNYSHSCAQICF